MNTELTTRLVRNEKISWLQEEEVEFRTFYDRYVPEALEPYIQTFDKQNPVIICAPTGTGKNTFIEEKLIPLLTGTNSDLLIVSNRVALNRQVKMRIAELVGCSDLLEDLTPRGLDKQHQFGNVDILTYQSLYELIESSVITQNYKCVVFDECHFFYSDSSFNDKTDILLERIPHAFKDSVRIYLTATPDDVMHYIIKSERKCLTKTFNHFLPSLHIPYRISAYIFSRTKPRNYTIRYFQEWTEIIERIKNDLTDEKWLIFVNSKKEGVSLQQELLTQSAVFVSSDSKFSRGKDGFSYNELITKECFNEKVLIATSVLNNGINIKDLKLRNIVLSTLDKTEFLQMLGRKRIINESDYPNIYYLAHSKGHIARKFHQCTEVIAAMQLLKKNPARAFSEYIHGANEIRSTFCPLLRYNGNRITWNKIGADRLYRERDMYSNLLQSECVKTACVKQMLSWLSLENLYSEEHYITFSKETAQGSKLPEFLNSFLNKPMLQLDQKAFSQQFQEIFELEYGKRGNNLDRSDRVYGLNIIRKCLEEKALPFTIESTGNPSNWIIRERDRT